MSMIRNYQRRAMCAVVALTWFVGGEALAQPASSAADVTGYRALLDQYCVTCHSERVVSGAGDRTHRWFRSSGPLDWRSTVLISMRLPMMRRPGKRSCGNSVLA